MIRVIIVATHDSIAVALGKSNVGISGISDGAVSKGDTLGDSLYRPFKIGLQMIKCQGNPHTVAIVTNTIDRLQVNVLDGEVCRFDKQVNPGAGSAQATIALNGNLLGIITVKRNRDITVGSQSTRSMDDDCGLILGNQDRMNVIVEVVGIVFNNGVVQSERAVRLIPGDAAALDVWAVEMAVIIRISDRNNKVNFFISLGFNWLIDVLRHNPIDSRQNN